MVVIGVFHGAEYTLRAGANPRENLPAFPPIPPAPGRLGVHPGRGLVLEVAAGSEIAFECDKAEQGSRVVRT